MTKVEQNQIIKDVWAKHLSEEKDIPTDIANTYSEWVRGVIASATSQLTPQQPVEEEQEK